jgi:hypothetical protein
MEVGVVTSSMEVGVVTFSMKVGVVTISIKVPSVKMKVTAFWITMGLLHCPRIFKAFILSLGPCAVCSGITR